ncbi:PREDICTED: ephrin type-B receptor 1-B-like isoform X3 [Acropora digitifera]|uniref:ephrin type-B receptor 1-B-like isoform X3 n=1 Tax=Acropora digitifera TaxID=70779 RepID=UPI00077ADF2F|nr:PREDICTED: ephrin type-B receptor 1-B-like isoform X3 [Acropora digitifera]
MEHLWISGLIALVFSSWASSKQQYIMEAPDCRTGIWDWETSASLPINGKISSWYHPSGLNTNIRYAICNPDNKQEPNNWLRSYVIEVGDIGRLEVTFTYSIKACQPSAPFCKEYFYAYVWESNTSVTTEQIPHPIKAFQLYRRFANVTRQSYETNLTVPLEVTSKYIVMGIRDQGGCRELYSVKISYKVCIKKTLEDSLLLLPLTNTQEKSTPVQGSCGKNSRQIVPGNLTVFCDSDGEWNTSRLESKCVCKEDMENRGGVCLACPSRTFNEGKGFYCTETPSEPRSASVYFVNESSAVLTWLLPEITGTPIDMSYDVICQTSCEYFGSDCDDQTCNRGIDGQFTAVGLNTTIFTATNLAPFVNYTCKITAKNRVSKRAESQTQATDGERNSFTYVNLTTKGSVPGVPEDITVTYLAETNSIILSWIVKCKNGIIQEYRIEYFSVDNSSGSKNLSTRDSKIQIGSLLAGKTLRFQVYAVNNFGIGSPGVKTFHIPKVVNLGKLPLTFIAAASGGGAFVLIIVAAICFACVVRSRRRSAQSILSDYMRPLEQGFDSNLPMDQRRYINPENYLDLKELLQTFTIEVDRSNTKLNGLIGQGEFADVYKGSIQTPKGNLIVAFKVLRPGSSEKSQKDFLSEASIMGQFNHPNVIRLVGVVTQSCPMMILTEFLESGSLDHFLKTRKGKLTTIHLLGMARGVACGMVYLSEMNFIHRDLAARNILVGENLSCKVSDFGLSRELADDNPDSEYVTQGGKIAVRWTAPEALQSRKFSSASDVWSYGVLVWEIMSFSDRPYWEWNNYNVMNRVENGYRLPSPINCPKLVHNLMLNCWESDKTKRPTFADIVGSIDNFIRCPKDLNDDLSPVAEKFEAKPQQEFQSVDEWLHYINMDKYSDVFHAANINSLDKVTGLGDKELREMGIKLIGHRNKMTKSIQAMKENSVQ